MNNTMSTRNCPICRAYNPRKVEKGACFDLLICRHCDVGITSNTKMDSYLDSNKLGYSPESYLEESNLVRQEKKFLRILEFTRISFNNKHVLDIGGGYGLLSKILDSWGASVTLIEPVLDPILTQDTTVKHVKKNLEEFLKGAKGRFDVIFLLDVLEHLNDPKSVLDNLKNRLTEDGIIVLNVPNRSSLMARICKSWAWWMPEDHKFHFNLESLGFLVRKSGFEVVRTQTFESLYDFKKNLDGNFSDINNSFLRKMKKFAFFAIFAPVYILVRPLIHKLGYGGLLSVVITPHES